MNCVSIASDNDLNLNQCWLNVNWILINNHQWNLNRHSKFSFKIASENAVCKMADLSLYLNVINMRKCFLTFTPTATSTTDDIQKLKWFKIHWKLHSFNASCHHLTHWDRDKMATISQKTLSNAFSWMKMFEFRSKFHWRFFLRVQLPIFRHWIRWWLVADQATSHYLNQWWL